MLAIPIILISTQFRERAYDDKSLDFQVVLRLFFFMAMFGIPHLYTKTWKNYLAVRPQNIMYVLFIYYMVTAVSAPLPAFSAFNAFSLLVVCLYSEFLLRRYGVENTVKITIIAGTVICVLSLIVFVVIPDFAKMRAWNGHEFGPINRLRGVTGSANAIGSISAFTASFVMIFWSSLHTTRWRRFGYIALAAAGLCMILSLNRMSIGGFIFATYFYHVLIRRGNKGLVLSVVGGLLLAALVMAVSDSLLEALSRSGDAEELLSGTGRNEIWTVALEYWQSSPIIGYGFSSARSILPLDPRLFSVAAHAHNMYIEMLFAGGVIGYSIFMVAVMAPLIAMFKTRQWQFVAIYLFFLLRGVTEAAPFSGVAAFSTFVFFLCANGIYSPLTSAKLQVRADTCRSAARGGARAQV
jgi:O-antigen ligase